MIKSFSSSLPLQDGDVFIQTKDNAPQSWSAMMKMMAAMQIKLEAVEGLQEDVATLQADVKSIKVGKN